MLDRCHHTPKHQVYVNNYGLRHQTLKYISRCLWEFVSAPSHTQTLWFTGPPAWRHRWMFFPEPHRLFMQMRKMVRLVELLLLAFCLSVWVEASGFSCLLSRYRSCSIDGTISMSVAALLSVVNPDPIFSHKDNICLCAVQALSSKSRPNTLCSHHAYFPPAWWLGST